MKRDMELVRAILAQIEASPAPLWEVAGTDYDVGAIEYHMNLLHQAGLIQTVERQFLPYPSGVTLTWDGHEFLDNARDDTRWNRATAIAGKLGNSSIDILISILKSLAAAEIAKYLHLQP